MKTIFYEMNEVPKRLFDFYADAVPGSSFAHLKRNGRLFETVAQDVGHLSPWITWPSLHRGVPNIKHKISDLGQDLKFVNMEFPPLWDLLQQRGLSVGVFGSLQSYPLPKNLDNYTFYVPDTFAAGPECFPEKLNEFQKFNLSMVKKNGKNVSSQIAMKEAMSFLCAAPGLGLRGVTVKQLAKQLIAEKIDKNKLVRRRVSQIEIAFDFYLKALKKTAPDVSFFFTNHVASSMHRYWPTIFPNDYEQGKFDDVWLQTWRHEIPHAVKVANDQLASLIKLVRQKTDYRLVVLSSMGQAAVKDAQITENQVLITDISKLLSYIGINDNQWEPRLSMAPLIVIKIKNSQIKSKLKKLNDISVNNVKIEYAELETGDVRFEINCCNIQDFNILDTSSGASINPNDIGLSNVHLQDAAGSYAYHIPEGILIDYSGTSMDKKEESNCWTKISAMDVAPSILNSFDILKPSYMSGEKNLFIK